VLITIRLRSFALFVAYDLEFVLLHGISFWDAMAVKWHQSSDDAMPQCTSVQSMSVHGRLYWRRCLPWQSESPIVCV